MELQDNAGLGHRALMNARNTLLEMAQKSPSLTRVRHNGLDDTPQLRIDIDQRKAQTLGVSSMISTLRCKPAGDRPMLMISLIVGG